MAYSQELIDEVKRLYPDNINMHKTIRENYVYFT